MNPFEQLGIEPRFGLTRAEIEERARELGRTLHPDRFAGRPAVERRAALGRALEVNEAARLLKDPVARAHSMLTLRGQLIAEAEQPPADPEFLMEIMELRHELKQVGQERNAERVQTLSAEVRVKYDAVFSELRDLLDAPPPTEKDASSRQAETAARLVSTLKYYRRFFDEADALMDELD